VVGGWWYWIYQQFTPQGGLQGRLSILRALLWCTRSTPEGRHGGAMAPRPPQFPLSVRRPLARAQELALEHEGQNPPCGGFPFTLQVYQGHGSGDK